MSQMLQAASLLDALKQDCIDAWGLLDGKVHYEMVRIPEPGSSYAIIEMLPVAMDAGAARTVHQSYTFRITRREPKPASGNILLRKIAQANLLIAAIITGPAYNDIAFLPYITEFDPGEEDDPQSKYIEFSVTFTCVVSESHY